MRAVWATTSEPSATICQATEYSPSLLAPETCCSTSLERPPNDRVESKASQIQKLSRAMVLATAQVWWFRRRCSWGKAQVYCRMKLTSVDAAIATAITRIEK